MAIMLERNYKPSTDELRIEKEVQKVLTKEFGLENPYFRWDNESHGKHYCDMSEGKETKVHIRDNKKDVCSVVVLVENGLFVSYKRKGETHFVSTMKERVKAASNHVEKGTWAEEEGVRFDNTPIKETEEVEQWAKDIFHEGYSTEVRRKQIDEVHRLKEEDEKRRKEAVDRECQMVLENEIWHRAMDEYGENITSLYHD